MKVKKTSPTLKGTDALRSALVTRKMTQLQVAEELKVSKTTVSRWISGERVPDREHMSALRNLLGISPESWITP
jgi:transcriptional regulator with XRE-family HTH domain